MSLRNRVVDAGDEVKVDGEWRMPPKVDIVGGQQPGATRDHAHSVPAAFFFFQSRPLQIGLESLSSLVLLREIDREHMSLGCSLPTL